MEFKQKIFRKSIATFFNLFFVIQTGGCIGMLTTILHVQVVQPFNINVTLMFLKICCNGSNHSVHLTYSLSIFSFIGIISRILQQNIPKSSYFLPCDTYTALKLSKYGVISGPYFPVFGLNTEIYSVNLRIQSEYRKIRTRNNSVFGQFPCSGTSRNWIKSLLL